MSVYLRRIVLFALLLIVLSACNGDLPDQIARLSPTYYNCLNLDDQIQVQLNTHLEPVPEIVHSTSPDGNYQIVSVARTLDSRSLYLEDTTTGDRSLLDDAIHEVMRVVWAPNSQFVSYDWEGARDLWYRGIAETETGEIFLDGEGFRGNNLEAFSFDGEYLTMSNFNAVVSYQLIVFPTRNYRYDDPVTILEGVIRHAWSPIDHRLAYATFSGIGVLDLDTGRTYQEPHLTGDTFIQSRDFGFMGWSPDAHYLVISYGFSSMDYETGVYLAENQSLTLLTSFTSIAPYRLIYFFNASFSPDGRYYTYFKKLSSEDPYFDLWRFNFDTRQHELLAENLTYQQLTNENFVIVREESDEWWFEIRDKAGFLLQSYPLPTNDQRWFWSCYQLKTPFDDVIDCQKGDDFILFGVSGDTIWYTKFQDNNSSKILGSWISADNRFIVRILYQGDYNTWLEFIDLTTRHIYRVPEHFNSAFPLGPSGLGNIDIYPAPDEQSWLGLFGQVLFRLYPASDTWELVNIDGLIDHMVWSPDGQRYAFVTKYDYVATAGDLFVRETDGTKQWSLGVFPSSMLDTITCTHCGDILAPLRDHLAAESLH